MSLLLRVALCWTLAVASAFATAAAGVEAGRETPGLQTRWALDFQASLQAGAGKPTSVRLSGDWVTTVAAVRAHEYDVRFELSDLRFAGAPGQQAAADSIDDLRRRLQRPFWATCRADGGLVAMYFPRAMDPTERNLLQMIATELQLVRPLAPRQAWTAQERDGAGEYVALYAMPAANRIVKRKLKYLRTDGAVGAHADALAIELLDAEIRYQLQASGAIAAIDGGERARIRIGPGADGVLSTGIEIHARQPRVANDPTVIGSFARAQGELDKTPIVTHRADPAIARAQADDRLLEGQASQALLDAAAGDTVDPQLAARLAALFRRRPETVALAVARAVRTGSQPRLLRALSAAGTPASVAALVDLADRRTLPGQLRAEAIAALGQVRAPDAGTMRAAAALLASADPRVRNAARLACGSLARAGHAAHPAESSAINARLVADYHAAPDAGDAIEILDALGNTSGGAAVDTVLQATQSGDARVRAAAARALRLAPDDRADAALCAMMLRDADAQVRAAAIFAVRFRTPPSAALVQALIDVAKADASDSVRSNAVAELKQNRAAFPQIADALAHIAEHDANAGIRRQAKEGVADAALVNSNS